MEGLVLENVLSVLRELGKPYIVGSYAIFEALGIAKKTKDIDILLETDYEYEFIVEKLSQLGSIYLTQNQFGSIKMNYNGMEFDIWRAKDTNIFEDEFRREYKTAEDVIRDFGFNLYQVGIRPDGELFCTRHFMDYAINRELRLINDNIRNYKQLSLKAMSNDVEIRRTLKNKARD